MFCLIFAMLIFNCSNLTNKRLPANKETDTEDNNADGQFFSVGDKKSLPDNDAFNFVKLCESVGISEMLWIHTITMFLRKQRGEIQKSRRKFFEV